MTTFVFTPEQEQLRRTVRRFLADKSRLADQLAAESAAAGWRVVAAFHGPDADRPAPGSQDMRLTGAAGLLMIIDYADRWLLTNLTWLLKDYPMRHFRCRDRAERS